MPKPSSAIDIIKAFLFSIAFRSIFPFDLEYLIELLIRFEKIVVNESLSTLSEIFLSM